MNAIPFAFSALGWTATGVLFLIIWVLIAFWPARVARRKGHEFCHSLLHLQPDLFPARRSGRISRSGSARQAA